jgi:methylthioribose-1-phosphate isomerase
VSIMHTIEWDKAKHYVKMIDQRLLPGRLDFVICHTCDEIAEAIRNMTIRGAPAIGIAATFGLVLTAFNSQAKDQL